MSNGPREAAIISALHRTNIIAYSRPAVNHLMASLGPKKAFQEARSFLEGSGVWYQLPGLQKKARLGREGSSLAPLFCGNMPSMVYCAHRSRAWLSSLATAKYLCMSKINTLYTVAGDSRSRAGHPGPGSIGQVQWVDEPECPSPTPAGSRDNLNERIANDERKTGGSNC